MRYWPAGERCPHQVLVLWELLRFDLDTEKISAPPSKDDTLTINENICMTTAKSMNEKTCMSASTMNEKSMNEKTLHEKSNICMNEKTCMNEKSMNEKTLHEKSTDKLVPNYKIPAPAVHLDPWLFLDRSELGRMSSTSRRWHRLVGKWTPLGDFSAEVAARAIQTGGEDKGDEEEFKKTFQPTAIHVSWIWENLSAEIVLEHMGQYGPCMLEDWDFPGHTATIKYEDPQDAQRALSAKDEDVKIVPAVS